MISISQVNIYSFQGSWRYYYYLINLFPVLVGAGLSFWARALNALGRIFIAYSGLYNVLDQPLVSLGGEAVSFVTL